MFPLPTSFYPSHVNKSLYIFICLLGFLQIPALAIVIPGGVTVSNGIGNDPPQPLPNLVNPDICLDLSQANLLEIDFNNHSAFVTDPTLIIVKIYGHSTDGSQVTLGSPIIEPTLPLTKVGANSYQATLTLPNTGILIPGPYFLELLTPQKIENNILIDRLEPQQFAVSISANCQASNRPTSDSQPCPDPCPQNCPESPPYWYGFILLIIFLGIRIGFKRFFI